MMSVTEYTKLKTAADKAAEAATRAEGAYEQALKQLKKDFGVEDLDAAKALLEELRGKEDAAEALFNEKLEKFKEDFPNVAGTRATPV